MQLPERLSASKMGCSSLIAIVVILQEGGCQARRIFTYAHAGAKIAAQLWGQSSRQKISDCRGDHWQCSDGSIQLGDECAGDEATNGCFGPSHSLATCKARPYFAVHQFTSLSSIAHRMDPLIAFKGLAHNYPLLLLLRNNTNSKPCEQACGMPPQTANSEATWASARRWNAQTRDFTVNALMYDPFASIIYDYTSGVADCR